jgi:hypothetical protein
MTGVVYGLALNDALAGMPGHIDRDFARRLLVIAEISFVAAVNRKSEDNDG